MEREVLAVGTALARQPPVLYNSRRASEACGCCVGVGVCVCGEREIARARALACVGVGVGVGMGCMSVFRLYVCLSERMTY